MKEHSRVTIIEYSDVCWENIISVLITQYRLFYIIVNKLCYLYDDIDIVPSQIWGILSVQVVYDDAKKSIE